MIEIYVLLTLGALGYLLNKTNNNVKKPVNARININETPSMKNIYESDYYDKTNSTLKQKAHKKYEESYNPDKTNNISYNYQLIRDDSQKENPAQRFEKSKGVETKFGFANKREKSLSGDYIDSSNFIHNNMVPFLEVL